MPRSRGNEGRGGISDKEALLVTDTLLGLPRYLHGYGHQASQAQWHTPVIPAHEKASSVQITKTQMQNKELGKEKALLCTLNACS